MIKMKKTKKRHNQNIKLINIKNYPQLIGEIWGNIYSLEFSLRIVILRSDGDKNTTFHYEKQKEGNLVPVTPLTNYDSLGNLIDKYHAICKKCHEDELLIQKDKILRVRDGFAHGRVSASPDRDYLFLFKFSKPENGNVKVEIAKELNEQFLESQIKLTYLELMKVHRFYRKYIEKI